jgi:DNA-binding beta-propeller fold protein YncE
MAKRKRSSKGRGRRKRGRAGLFVFVGFVAIVIIGAITLFALKDPVIRPLAVEVAMSCGGNGSGRGDLSSPRGVAVDAKGNIYAVDLGNSRVNKYGPEGNFLLSFGRLGTKPVPEKPARQGEFNEPSGVAVNPQGDVFVADAWNGRVQRFDSKGKFLAEYGGAAYGFYSPRGVAVDAQGNIYVADTGRSRMQILNPDGMKLKEVGELGRGKGRFNEIFGIAINSKGEIFAADPGNGRIQKFSPMPEPKFMKDIRVQGWKRATPFWPQLAIDSQDRVYASDNNNRQIWVYDSQLKYLATLGGTIGHDVFANPVGLAVAPTGELVVGDMGKNMILKLKPLNLPAPK